jgi:repressor LexA
LKLTNIQTKILEVLRASIVSNESLSLREIAEKVGVKSANAVFYQIKRLEKAGVLNRDDFGKVTGVVSPDISAAIAYLPLLGNASCGTPFEEIEEERMIPAPLGFFKRGLNSKLYTVKAVGNSMAPRIQDGDYIVFEKNAHPNNGSVVVARTDHGFTIKVFKELKNELKLEPYNKAYDPLVFQKNQQGKQFVVDGVAVGVFKPQENLEGSGN